jgi:hypothetical protein
MLDREKDMIAIPGFPYYFVKGTDIVSQKWGGYRILKQGLHSNGYLIICLQDPNGKQITKKVHRLIAQAHLPDYSEDLDVDHIDRCRTNNNISNLRMVTRSENHQNRGGVKGYSFDKDKGKWKAMIYVDKKLKHLGYFDTEDEARQAYLKAKKIHHPTSPINAE